MSSSRLNCCIALEISCESKILVLSLKPLSVRLRSDSSSNKPAFRSWARARRFFQLFQKSEQLSWQPSPRPVTALIHRTCVAHGNSRVGCRQVRLSKTTLCDKENSFLQSRIASAKERKTFKQRGQPEACTRRHVTHPRMRVKLVCRARDRGEKTFEKFRFSSKAFGVCKVRL